MQLSISAELKAKIDEAERLLSHALPRGDLAALLYRALDALLEQEKKRRFGAGKPRQRRASKPSSRYVPVDVARPAVVVPPTKLTVRDSSRPRWRRSAPAPVPERK